MDRILAGTAQNSNGALTIVALAHEADVPRNALTQRHTDLKTEFYTRVHERDGTSEAETRLRTTITRLKNTITNKNTELEQLRADVPALVRTINVLTLENQQLRDARAQNDPTVIPFRPRRPTNDELVRPSALSARTSQNSHVAVCLLVRQGWLVVHCLVGGGACVTP
ncbi:MAG: hypothetical protein LC635_03120 [Pseudonocardiaceae bacterium]|nr:hypothetical protein [Pseudonocardiaceae bacterium]